MESSRCSSSSSRALSSSMTFGTTKRRKSSTVYVLGWLRPGLVQLQEDWLAGAVGRHGQGGNSIHTKKIL